MIDTRPTARGKFLFVGEEKLYVRGVTYGTFRPDDQGMQFPPRKTVEQDFAQMAAAGVNAVRVYTAPPVWLLDAARESGLYVMVGLPWEQHIAFLDQPGLAAAIQDRVRQMVRESAGHPAILAYVIGNEIPSSIVRWHGARRIERFLRKLYRIVKAEAPGTLVTYVNFPTTEYLTLPFLDFFCFNVYLEAPEKLEAYLARLQNLAGDRPLVMAEIGLDSLRNGHVKQSETLEWQIRTILAAGCSGLFIFAWTDEWYRGGYDIEDWDFGLTDRSRLPKPALAAVRSAFANIPFPSELEWPSVSVVVCTHNGSSTIRDCLEGLRRLEYPRAEIIVVDDGSTDETAAIVQEYPVRLIRTEHSGLASARNTGMDAAGGEIIAYLDDDAWPDVHWLQYLAWTYLHTDYAGVGGPNIPPPDDGPISECVANAPGGPVHVLIGDSDAEHIPGCNCSFRKDRLKAVGGFDSRFRTAGDDVDLCWQVLERGWKIGFHPGAMVWHHRRRSLRAFWKQQRNYGSAEAMLETKWPSKYTSFGSIRWEGRLYGPGSKQTPETARVYQGLWGTAPFQRIYSSAPTTLAALLLRPEWYLVGLTLAGLSLSTDGALQLLSALLCVTVAAIPLASIATSVAQTSFRNDKLRYRILTALLHVLQPIARLSGQLPEALARARRHGLPRWTSTKDRVLRIWSEQWRAPEDWLRSLEMVLAAEDIAVRRSGDFDSWDFEVMGGSGGGVRLKMAIEEHGAGKQMLLFHLRTQVTRFATGMFLFALFSSTAFFSQGRWLPGSALGIIFMLVLCRVITECLVAIRAVQRSIESLARKEPAIAASVAGVVYLGWS